mmetsp:Transcript_46656/g.110948  ORF Transcript_46656/g.110948 Transcript_46656/m.110948 type:complete len:790 (-) Transcript_46656:92-2461(-)
MGVSTSQTFDAHLADRRPVFVCLGQKSRRVQELLLQRGWVEGSLREGPIDFFWCQRVKQAQQAARVRQACGEAPPKLVNHFVGGARLHGKHWLNRCLNACPSCSSEVFPRQYYLGRASSLRLFIEDYLLTGLYAKAESSSAALGAARPSADASSRRVSVPKRAKDLMSRACKQSKAPGQALVARVCGHTESLARCAHDLDFLLNEDTASLQGSTGLDSVDDDVTCQLCSDVSEEVSSASRRSPLQCGPQHRSFDGPGNAWIIKPAMSSRGRGVAVFRDIRCLLDRAAEGCQPWEFVAQKYLERPLLLAGRKVDLRLWVLVSSWTPHTVAYAYREPYFRQASQPLVFDTFSETGLLPKQAHVTNRTVHSDDNRLRLEDFLSRMADERRRRVATAHGCSTDVRKQWRSRTWPQLLDGVRAVLLAAHPVLAAGIRRHADSTPSQGFELYGFDFALDADMRPWLLEVNCSPDMLAGSDVSEEMQQWAREATGSLLDLVTVAPDTNVVSIDADGCHRACPVEPRPLVQSATKDSGHSQWSRDAASKKQSRCYGLQLGSLPADLIAGHPVQAARGWSLVLDGRHLSKRTSETTEAAEVLTEPPKPRARRILSKTCPHCEQRSSQQRMSEDKMVYEYLLQDLPTPKSPAGRWQRAPPWAGILATSTHGEDDHDNDYNDLDSPKYPRIPDSTFSAAPAQQEAVRKPTRPRTKGPERHRQQMHSNSDIIPDDDDDDDEHGDAQKGASPLPKRRRRPQECTVSNQKCRARSASTVGSVTRVVCAAASHTGEDACGDRAQ